MDEKIIFLMNKQLRDGNQAILKDGKIYIQHQGIDRAYWKHKKVIPGEFVTEGEKDAYDLFFKNDNSAYCTVYSIEGDDSVMSKTLEIFDNS